jgi:hypothetical protein
MARRRLACYWCNSVGSTEYRRGKAWVFVFVRVVLSASASACLLFLPREWKEKTNAERRAPVGSGSQRPRAFITWVPPQKNPP